MVYILTVTRKKWSLNQKEASVDWGEYVKPTALANVRAFAQRLKPEIKIIGTGGITCGKDVFEHLLCGATLVQVGTQLHQEGPQVFERLAKELQEIMAAKGYESIEEFRGKLKEM